MMRKTVLKAVKQAASKTGNPKPWERRSVPKSPKSPQTSGPAAAKTQLPQVDESNIDEAEKETLERSNRTLSALKLAIASWDSSKEKPEELRPKFMKYQRLYEVLAEWRRRTLQIAGMREAFDERVTRLWEFVDICQTYT